MTQTTGFDDQLILNGLAQGVLIFDAADRLIRQNAAARDIFGSDLKLISSEGWAAAAVLFDTKQPNAAMSANQVRAQALKTRAPVRFHIYRSGERVPCWVSALEHSGETFTMIAVERPDWTALADLLDKYFEEVREVAHATQGHADLITRTVTAIKPNATADSLRPRVTGFTRLIDIHMYRLRLLTDLIERLEHVRTGVVRDLITLGRKRVVLTDFLEDFLEELSEIQLVDPETAAGDVRSRLQTIIPQKMAVAASPTHLANILHDVLRNAIMYSKQDAPVKIVAFANRDATIQIDVIDEGCGIRATEGDRVFSPFARSRQPQVMSEFGYGLSLYLCKHEIEAMNGRIWYESEEGIGTTFSLKLPVWRDSYASSSES